MLKVKLIKIFFILFFLSIVFFVVYSKFFEKEEIITTDVKIDEEVTYNSNIINININPILIVVCQNVFIVGGLVIAFLSLNELK